MRNTISLIVLFIMPLVPSAQTKKLNIFLDAGYNFYSSTVDGEKVDDYSSAYPVAAATLNYAPSGKFGFGASLEAGGVKAYESNREEVTDLTLAALADFRYYLQINRGTIIPLIQVGYNFYSGGLTVSGVSVETKNKGQGAIGAAFAYQLFKNGGGLTISAKYSLLRYSTQVTNAQTSLNITKDTDFRGGIVTLGLRF